MPASPAVEPSSVVLLTRVERELRSLFGRVRALTCDIARSAHLDLDPALAALLLTVAEEQPVRPVELADTRACTKGVISRQVAALERLGLVSRRGDPLDARASWVELTPSGARVACSALEGRQRFTERLLHNMTIPELEDLARVLGTLNRAIGC